MVRGHGTPLRKAGTVLTPLTRSSTTSFLYCRSVCFSSDKAILRSRRILTVPYFRSFAFTTHVTFRDRWGKVDGKGDAEQRNKVLTPWMRTLSTYALITYVTFAVSGRCIPSNGMATDTSMVV